MIDTAGIEMAQGYSIACERIEGVNDNMTKSHYHDFYELYYLEGGERYHIMEDESYFMHAGEFMIFPPYVMHRSFGTQDTPFRRIVLYFRPEEIASDNLRNVLKNSVGLCQADKKSNQTIRSLLNLLAKEGRNNAYDEEFFHSTLNLLLITILRNVTPTKIIEKQSRMEKILQYIHYNYHEKITLETLAQTFYISPYYLCREFKAQTNRTVVQYINITRVMNAQRKIMETTKSLTDISSETGFSNLTHFNRVFKSVTGVTPSEYRKNHPAKTT